MVHLCRHGLDWVPVDHGQGKSLVDPSRSTSYNVCEGSDLARSNEGSVNSNGRLKRGTGAVTEIINRNRGVLDLRQRRSVIGRGISDSHRWASECSNPAGSVGAIDNSRSLAYDCKIVSAQEDPIDCLIQYRDS